MHLRGTGDHLISSQYNQTFCLSDFQFTTVEVKIRPYYSRPAEFIWHWAHPYFLKGWINPRCDWADSLAGALERTAVRLAALLKNPIQSTDQAQMLLHNYKVVPSPAGGQNCVHKWLLSLITAHWLLLCCLKVSSASLENSRGADAHTLARSHTHKRACFFSEVRFTFWKVHRFPWESVSFPVNADPELSLCQKEGKTIRERLFHGWERGRQEEKCHGTPAPTDGEIWRAPNLNDSKKGLKAMPYVFSLWKRLLR